MRQNRVLIIGFGHHAKRIYFPIIAGLPNAKIAGIVDLSSETSEVENYLRQKKADNIATLFLDNTTREDVLTNFAKANQVNCVVISTGPEDHVKYASWAFSNGYHVLMDKPIHTEKLAAHSRRAARKIHSEYLTLLEELNAARLVYPNLVCEVLAQRRHHPAFQLLKDTVDETYDKTSCPITYYYALHNDGQWRLPNEINEIDYHGFNNGYGKASHSGYHFYDLLNWFSDRYREEKNIDSILIKSRGNFPENYLRQIDPEVLRKAFPANVGRNYRSKLNPAMGEIDVMSTIQLLSSDHFVTHAQIDLLHSGFSARDWAEIGDRDLYKGNGRVRHEQHYLDMGPFMSASITSWQSKPFQSESLDSPSIYNPGHELNLDINIFRNTKIVGGERAASYTLRDFLNPVLTDYSRGHQEEARRNGIIDFLDLIDSGVAQGESALEKHELSSMIMSGVYESLATKAEVISSLQGSLRHEYAATS